MECNIKINYSLILIVIFLVGLLIGILIRYLNIFA